ncbi:phage-related putative DNA-binding protein [plant metagenome]|uniref:Phage-related putative DNA-binding protein n=1 Tax=plant metagenome TaxID=1297885 RepID=A0A484TBH4_9ZZZZ
MTKPKTSAAEIKRHELLLGVEDHARTILVEHGIAADVADQVAIAIADHLAQDWGGQYVVIPTDYHYKIAQRDIHLCRSFTGDFTALAKAAGMTESGARKMYNRFRRYWTAVNQGRLFD